DADQLGNLVPDPAGDPGRHLLQADNLGAMLAGFRAAGARCAVVSGVLDPARGAPVERLGPVAPTVCLLRAGRDELERRLLGRGDAAALVPEVLRAADALDAADVAEVRIDTDGLPPAEAARLVLERTGWPGPGATAPAPPRRAPAGDPPPSRA